jgi:hypothetical protein
MTGSTTDVALEERLRSMTVDAPPALVARVLATAAVMPNAPLPDRRVVSVRRRIALAAIGFLIFVGGNGVAAHLIPAYASILQRIPIAGPLLENTGIFSSADVVPANDTSTDHGYTLHVVGSYADASGTQILFTVEGPAGGDPPNLVGSTTTLTDQFGTIYMLDPHDLGSGSFGIGASPDWSLNFEPLRGAAIDSTVFVTMRVRGLSSNTQTGRDASWQLRFKVKEQRSLPATTPAPIQLGSDHYTFHQVIATNARIDFTFTQTGNRVPYPITGLSAHPASGVLCPGCIVGVPFITFYGPDGQVYQDLSGTAWPTAAKTSEASVVFASHGPGTYRFTLTAVNGYSVRETFVIG